MAIEHQHGFLGYADNGCDIIECWQCGGEGTIASCHEEWACVDPESGCDMCIGSCDICDGKGSYTVAPPPRSPECDTEKG